MDCLLLMHGPMIYKLVGFSAKARNNPLIAEREDGKQFKLSIECFQRAEKIVPK